MEQSARNEPPAEGTVLGLPLKGFGAFTSLLLAVAAAFFAFFASTALAIFSLLAWNLLGRHEVNYADSYRYVGLPAGALALVVALSILAVLGVRARLRR